MDRTEVEALLRGVASGGLGVDAALEQLAAGPMSGTADLGFARVDTHRGLRTGDPEVVYADGKTPEQTVAILRELGGQAGAQRAIATRVPDETMALLRSNFPDAHFDATARAVALGPSPEPRGTVCVVSAGTSDAPVAAEAAFVARAFGAAVQRVDDVGVAGLHRVTAARAQLDSADCLIVVAGMEGALPSVVGGLTGVPLVAVPTSVGYGASYGGLAALLAMLNSCAPGVVVCNVDNGFGAGVFAARVARRAHPIGSRPAPDPAS
jgi:pyridinium-3,5-biscarboxylic acid mononucleotide synthase